MTYANQQSSNSSSSGAGFTVCNLVPQSVNSLQEPQKEKACYLMNSRLSLCRLVGRHRLELWTKGL